MIFDDVLTGLDRITEQRILESVFSKQGLLKQINRTVVLATNSGSVQPASVICENYSTY